eukprot:2497397-Rhodomonas_salina.1
MLPVLVGRAGARALTGCMCKDRAPSDGVGGRVREGGRERGGHVGGAERVGHVRGAGPAPLRVRHPRRRP